MGSLSIWHLVIVLAVVMVLFGGRGKISSLMGDLGKGLKSFKAGMKDEEVASDEPTKRVEGTTLDAKPAPSQQPGSTAPKA